MKSCVIICDGMADLPSACRDGETPLELACTPNMDRLASMGMCGSVLTIPDGFYPGSETGILTIMGCPAENLPKGRGYLEALGLGLDVRDHDVTVARYILNSDEVNMSDLQILFPNLSFHVLSGKTGLVFIDEANSDMKGNDDVVFWSHSVFEDIMSVSYFSKYVFRSKCALVGAIPLVKGIASACRMDWISPNGATGDLWTDYAAKANAALEALESHDTVFLHVEACDTASHAKDFNAKREAIEKIDSLIIERILRADQNNEFAISVVSDHLSVSSMGTHAVGNVPIIIYVPGNIPDAIQCFNETEVMRGRVGNLQSLYALYG